MKAWKCKKYGLLVEGNGNYQKQMNLIKDCYSIFYLLFLGKNMEVEEVCYSINVLVNGAAEKMKSNNKKSNYILKSKKKKITTLLRYTYFISATFRTCFFQSIFQL